MKRSGGGGRDRRPPGRGGRPDRPPARSGPRRDDKGGKLNQLNRLERSARKADESARKAGDAARAKRPRPHPSSQRDEKMIQRPRPERERVRAPRPPSDLADAVEAAEPPPQIAVGVQTVVVGPDENGMRVDRFLEAKFPGLSFAHIQRIVRKGELRVDGKRADSKDRLEEGQKVRIPPIKRDAPPHADEERRQRVLAELKAMTLFEDDDVLVINKPYGLAVQGGSGTTRHVDGMLTALMQPDGQRPRLVHRLDKDTAGCLVIAKTRFAASTLTKTFRTRSARKIYWAMVSGVPRTRQGRISTYVAREQQDDGDSRMKVARHGDEGASHALTYYAVVETSAQKLSWLSLKPVTGRTHQLRVHTAEMGHPIIGDPKYFNIENWNLPGGIQNRLHLLARRIVLPHPRGNGVIDVSAPLPPHMQQTWNLLGLDAKRYDPILDAPDD